MKISLITACFKSAGTLRTALDSVLEQKGVDLDYIVVDGGSNDGTVELLKVFLLTARTGSSSQEIISGA